MKKRIFIIILCCIMIVTALPLPLEVGAAAITVDVPISVDFTNATGVDLNIRLNPLLVDTAVLVNPANSMKDAFYLDYQTDDKVKVAIASATPLSNTGVLFYLRLTLKQEANADDELCKLLQVKINEQITWQAENCILLTGVQDGAAYNRNVTIHFNEGTATLNGTAFKGGNTVTAAGDYVLQVTDLNGKKREVHFSIDRTAPVITITPFSTEPTQAPFTVTATVSGGTLNTTSYTFRQNGSFTFIATDAAGNVAQKTVTVSHLYQNYSIAITKKPEQTVYLEGDAFQKAGMVVTVYYDNGTSAVVTDYTLSGYTSTPGTKTITVAYGGATATFTVKVSVFPFVDVAKDQWYYETIREAYRINLMYGANDTQFKPNTPMTRGMMATVLYRMAGSPNVNFFDKFPDVAEVDWYALPISWAARKGVINGYNSGRFAPNDNVTREQVATMLCNYAKSVGKYKAATNTSLDKFNDGNKVSSYAVEAMQWAVANGLLNGKDNGTRLDPQGTATRAECTKMLLQAYKILRGA